jgi:Ca-activated chloride channel family protein
MGDFHFIRPWWLCAIPLLGALLWLMRNWQDAVQAWQGVIAPQLLPHLLSGGSRRSRFTPLHLIGITWLIAVIAVAGPTWRREPAPFAEDTATLVIVLRVAPSMLTEDVPPSRLARSVEKIRDLLKERRGAKNALIAYSGTAHLVMPPTSDGGIIDTFAQALDPKIMPEDGDCAADALRLADQTLAGVSGSILWITDSVAPEQKTPLAAWRKKSGTPVRLLPPLLAGSELDAVSTAAEGAKARLVQLAADDSDVATLAQAAKFSTAASANESNRWQESGYWLTPPLALLVLPFFRKGWMAPSANSR